MKRFILVVALSSSLAACASGGDSVIPEEQLPPPPPPVVEEPEAPTPPPVVEEPTPPVVEEPVAPPPPPVVEEPVAPEPPTPPAVEEPAPEPEPAPPVVEEPTPEPEPEPEPTPPAPVEEPEVPAPTPIVPEPVTPPVSSLPTTNTGTGTASTTIQIHQHNNRNNSILESISLSDFADTWENHWYANWITTDVANAWRDGWTGEGVKVGIVDDFANRSIRSHCTYHGRGIRDYYCQNYSHGKLVRSIIQGVNFQHDTPVDGGGWTTAPKFYPGFAPNAEVHTWNFANTAPSQEELEGISIFNHSYGTFFRQNTAAGPQPLHPVWYRAWVENVNNQVSTYKSTDRLNIIAAGNFGLDCLTVIDCSATVLAHTGNLQLNRQGTFYYRSDDTIDWTRDPNNTAIIVGAVEDNNTLSTYSHKAGMTKNDFIVAKGDSITRYSRTFQGNIYETRSGAVKGTSFAAPRVTGTAVLLKDKFDNLNPTHLKHIILNTADDLGAPGVDDVFGHGRLNVGAALSPVGNIR